MSADPYREELIARYLLGDLPEEQQIEIEDRAFQDQEYQQRLTAVENDLIDEYVRRELSDTQRRQFEARFLASADRRRRVEFARALSTIVDEAKVQEPETRRADLASRLTWRDAFAAFVHGLAPAARFSLATAALLLVAAGAWLITQSMRQRAQLARLQSEQQSQQEARRALQQQIDSARKQNEDLTAQLEDQKQQSQQRDELIQQLQSGAEDSERQTSRATIFSLSLLPGLSRSGNVHPKLVLPEAARLVRLQIGVEPEDQFRSFRVELVSPDGRQVWTRDNLSARTTKSGQTIPLTLPAKVLKPGHYELALKGLTDEGRTEDVGYYYFEVLRK